jgi:hypothetical protein
MSELGLYDEIPHLGMTKAQILNLATEDFLRKGYDDQAKVLAHFPERVHFVNEVPSDLKGATGSFIVKEGEGFNIYVNFNQPLRKIMKSLFHESTHWDALLHGTIYSAREIFGEFHAWKKTLEYTAENCNLTPQGFFQERWIPNYVENRKT